MVGDRRRALIAGALAMAGAAERYRDWDQTLKSRLGYAAFSKANELTAREGRRMVQVGFEGANYFFEGTAIGDWFGVARYSQMLRPEAPRELIPAAAMADLMRRFDARILAVNRMFARFDEADYRQKVRLRRQRRRLGVDDAEAGRLKAPESARARKTRSRLYIRAGTASRAAAAFATAEHFERTKANADSLRRSPLRPNLTSRGRSCAPLAARRRASGPRNAAEADASADPARRSSAMRRRQADWRWRVSPIKIARVSGGRTRAVAIFEVSAASRDVRRVNADDELSEKNVSEPGCLRPRKA